MKLAVGPAQAKWLSKVELMNRVPLQIKEAVIFPKLSRVIVLTLSGHFLELSLELFFLPIRSGHLWAKSWGRSVCNAMVQIAVIVLAWPFMYHNECGRKDFASCILRIVIIAVTWSFMCHSKCWGRIVPTGVVWTVFIAMAWASLHNTKYWGRVIPKDVVWIVVIPMASPFMHLIELLGRIIVNGVVWIVVISMASPSYAVLNVWGGSLSTVWYGL
jgi:hypothetical protein